MPVSLVRYEVNLQFTSGVPRDVAINTFHFLHPDAPTEPEIEAILEQLGKFYNDTYAPLPLSDYIGAIVDRDNCHVDIAQVLNWDTGADDVVVPFGGQPFALGDAASGTGLPTEVAVVLSFRGVTPAGGGAPYAAGRRRGRIYFGPLHSGAIGSAEDGFPDVDEDLREALCASANDMQTSLFEDSPWVVYSPTEHGATPVTIGHVNNEFDTQRRRGVGSTRRTTF